MSEKENNMCDVCGSGSGRCGSCGNMCGFGGSHILRWVLGILIIVWVFSIGMKFGEIKAYLDQAGYGRGYNHRTYPMPMMGATGWQGGSDEIYFSQAVPASPATVTVSSGTLKTR